jgi:hypothetical protein
MTLSGQDYRARAAQCEHMAERHRDPTFKAQYLELARQWLDLAEQAEKDQGMNSREVTCNRRMLHLARKRNRCSPWSGSIGAPYRPG